MHKQKIAGQERRGDGDAHVKITFGFAAVLRGSATLVQWRRGNA